VRRRVSPAHRQSTFLTFAHDTFIGVGPQITAGHKFVNRWRSRLNHPTGSFMIPQCCSGRINTTLPAGSTPRTDFFPSGDDMRRPDPPASCSTEKSRAPNRPRAYQRPTISIRTGSDDNGPPRSRGAYRCGSGRLQVGDPGSGNGHVQWLLRASSRSLIHFGQSGT
jgi:hypothetical protein